MERFPLTQEGLTKLEAELKHLKNVERPEVIEAIAEARAHGDLSENAEYHAARERQSFIEGRIQELEAVTGRAEVVDPKKLSGTTVRFGATVTVFDEETEKETTYQIVGDYEADIDNGLLSYKAPIARAVIGKEEGDSITVPSPGGERYIEILKVEYK
ncbi:MAG: transcription elongation factor GreA [Rickettsiales bacterium]|nr:transcription elongation factor GreA [Rickettsiales bacterium]